MDFPAPAINPANPSLSKKGKTVLIAGGSTGIGHSIARAFLKASASRVIILSRRKDVLSSTVSALQSQFPKSYVDGRVCDSFDRTDVDKMWEEFRRVDDETSVDVLVLNAVGYPAMQPILEQGVDRLWEDYERNVKAQLYMVEKFYKQPNHTSQKHCLYVSSQSIHMWDSAPQMPGYQLTKSACTTALQTIACDTPSSKMQIVSFHPGLIFTEAAKSSGYTEESLPWNDEDLPGCFAVWAASSEAEFLHGRFVWANWDVEELASGEVRAKIDADAWYLKVGVKGL